MGFRLRVPTVEVQVVAGDLPLRIVTSKNDSSQQRTHFEKLQRKSPAFPAALLC